jgi:hypothetical protein
VAPDTNKIKLDDVYVPSEKVVAREIEGEIIIVPLEGGVADFNDALYTLNETGRRIWDLLDPRTSLGMICDRLTEEFNETIENIKKDVLGLFQKLIEMEIVKKIEK